MTKPPKRSIFSSPKAAKPTKPTLSPVRQAEVIARANEWVETELKPKHVQPPPAEPRFNYIEDLYTKWYRGALYFCATYRVPRPDADAPTFEARFARLSYAGWEKFNLAFMRHTGQWIEPYEGLSLDEALESIRDDPFFIP